MKRIILFLTLFFTIPSVVADQQTYTPENTIFLWDLHDVILNKDIPGIINLVWQYPHMWDALKRTNGTLLLGTFKLSVRSIFKQEGLGTEFLALTKQARNPFVHDLFIKIVNMQKPIEGTVAIIKDLHELGYTHHLGSNIDAEILQELTNAKHNPQFVSLFDYFDLNRSHMVTYDTDIIKKPDIRYFLKYLEKNTIDPTKMNIIFIDDTKANVETAKKAGLIGIQFISPAQLRSQFQTMGILPKTKPVAACAL